MISLLQARAVSMNTFHLTCREWGFPGGASWSYGCLGVNGINWEQLAPSRDPPAVPVGGQALATQLSGASCPQQVRAHRCTLQLMPPGLALSLCCSAPPVPNQMWLCQHVPLFSRFVWIKSKTQSAGMSPNPTPASNRDQSDDML